MRLLWLSEGKEALTRTFLHMSVGKCPFPPPAGRVLTPSQCRSLGVHRLLVGGIGQVELMQSHNPTWVPKCWEALLVLPAPGGLALVEHCLERRCFMPGHIWAVEGKGRWSAFLWEPVESRVTTKPSSRPYMTVCLDDGKCKRQFWKVNSLSVVREDRISICV